MKLPSWLSRKQSAVARVVSFMMTLGRGIPIRVDYESYAKEGYQLNSVIHSCVKEIAEAAAGIPIILYRRMHDGELDELQVHPLLDLMARPNPLMGRFEFVEQAISFLEISGNNYIEKVSPGSGTPRELYNLRPDRMTVVPHRTELIAGYEYKIGGAEAKFERDKIQHTRLFHPTEDWYGLSPIQVAALAIDKMNEGDRWNASLLNNSAVPSGALVAKAGLNDQQFARLKSEMREQIQGAKNAGEPLLLENDLDWKSLSVNPKDMDWIESMKFSAMQIAQIYNVPGELIGLLPATYQNRKEARKALYTEAVCPALTRLIDGMNASIVPAFGDDLVLAMNKDGIEALSEDQESLWKRANESQFLTVNEKRALVGYEAIGAEGDQVLAPVNLLPLGDAVGGTQEEGAEEDPDLEEDEKCLHHRSLFCEGGGGDLDFKAFSKRDRKRFRREFIEVARMRDRLASKFRRFLRARFNKELGLVVQAFRRGGEIDALDAVTAEAENWRKVFEGLHKQTLSDFASRSLENLKSESSGDLEFKADEIDASIDLFESLATKFAKEHAAVAVANVGSKTKKALASLIGDAVEAGLGVDEVVGQIKDKYKEFGTVRAKRIARTEIHKAQNKGQVESIRSLGRADMEKGWLWSQVSRSSHAAIDGTWVPMEDKFSVPGADAPMDRPGDPAGGPQAVVNCSCTLVFRRTG
jgi:HK97 family phage portal protein